MALGIRKLLIKAGKGALVASTGIDLGGASRLLTEEQADQLKEIITAGVAAGMLIAANGIEDEDEK